MEVKMQDVKLEEEKPKPTKYWPGNKECAGYEVKFAKSGDKYIVGEGGNLINQNKPISKKKQRKLNRRLKCKIK
jgi:hypothetical protein